MTPIDVIKPLLSYIIQRTEQLKEQEMNERNIGALKELQHINDLISKGLEEYSKYLDSMDKTLGN